MTSETAAGTPTGAPAGSSAPLPEQWRRVAEAVADPDRFVSASVTGARRGTTPPAGRITLRPVDLKAGRRVQCTRSDGPTSEVENLEPDAASELILELLGAGAANVVVRTLDADLQLRHSRRGRPHLVEHRPTAARVDTSHDRTKARWIEPGSPVLAALGMTDEQGRIVPSARAKYRQVERFVELLDHVVGRPDGPVRAVDLGCGSGALTLAAHHHLRRIAPGSTMLGVDTKADLMDRLAAITSGLGWDEVEFRTAAIDEADLGEPVDLVLALHACDTATDDALARAVRAGARVILAAPCCQHDLQTQLDRHQAPDGFDALMRDGIVTERLGDLLTDALRAEILRAHGYRTDVVEFVATEHTPKNLMIRAVRTDPTGSRRPTGSAAAAQELAGRWQVVPALARRIGWGADEESGGDAPTGDRSEGD